jgi:hypothetical protein
MPALVAWVGTMRCPTSLFDCIKQRPVHDDRLLARQDLILVFDLADIEAIAQQKEQRAPSEGNAASGSTGCKRSYLGTDVPLTEIPHQCIDAGKFRCRW